MKLAGLRRLADRTDRISTAGSNADERNLHLTDENFDMRSEIEQLKIAQATQAATLAGAQATQAVGQAGVAATSAAAQAGTVAMMVAGSASLVLGLFLGIAITSTRGNGRTD
jgi:predicted phage tail protein